MTDTLITKQVSPAAATQVDLYTVPAATKTVVSTLVVCNQNTAKVKVRVRVRALGAANDVKQFVLFDTTVLGNTSEFYTLGIALSPTDVVSVQSDTTLTSFTMFGVEVT